MKPIELVVGSIRELNTERLAMQSAYFKSDAEIQRLRGIIHRQRHKIKRLLKRLKDRV